MSDAVIDKYQGLVIDAIERPVPNVSSPDFCMRVLWSSPRIGFGEVTFYWDGDKLCADTECMSEAFLKRLLLLLTEQIEIRE